MCRVFCRSQEGLDVVSHEILLKKLNKLGITGSTLAWFKSYLSERKQIVDINGTFSSEMEINCSIMQGSSLGPILFLCFINDFPSSTILKVYMFADDTTYLMAGTNIEELINLVNVEVQKMANWYRANRLAVNTSKSKYIIFHGKGKKINFIPQIFYNSNEIGAQNDPNLVFPLVFV